MRTLATIRREIRASWPAIVAKARTRSEALQALPKAPSLLGTGTKTEKGEGEGYLTAVVYMSPAREAFAPGDTRTLCPNATYGPGGCFDRCLGRMAGRMIMRPVEAARLWKATLYMGARALWRELLEAEIRSFEASARRQGLRPVVRIDGSTDTLEGERLALSGAFPGVTFYDYTKSPTKALRHLRSEAYHVTFSRSGANDAEALQVLQAGGNVAVVFSTTKGEALPTTWQGFPVIDGDVTDLRFLDPKGGHVVGLRFKAAKARGAKLAEALRHGFAVQA